MKDKLIKAALSFAVVCVLGACTKNYLDINSNPYEVDKEQMEAKDYAIASGLSAMFGTVVSTDVNTAQFTDCLLGSTQGGYYADANNGWTNTISKYNPTDNWTNVFMYSDKVIPQLYSNMSNVEGISEDPLVLAILKIVKVCVLNRVTDTYGPIPYSEIGSTGKIQVAYDDQPKVYSQMFDELDEAIALLDENIDRSITSTTDQVFDGTAVKWCRFANSMKLRLAMRVVYTDFVSSKGLSPQQLGEQAVAHSVGVMQSNADNAQLSSLAFGKDGNPLYTACMYNSPAGSVTGGDSHAAADIICYMNGYEDPRREKYFSKAQFSGDNAPEYVGMRRGIAIPALSTVGLLYSGVNFVDGMATPLQWMNAAEVAFLKAEAVGVFGWNMGGSAKTFYEQGVRLSFEQWGVAGVDEYLVGTTLPESYTDPNGGATSYSTQLSQLGVAWNDGASKEEMQERIIIQKWIANFHLGNEAWADFRRTGFPHLIPAMESAVGNNSQGIRNLTLGARRMSYPADEATNNPENYAKAVIRFALHSADQQDAPCHRKEINGTHAPICCLISSRFVHVPYKYNGTLIFLRQSRQLLCHIPCFICPVHIHTAAEIRLYRV